MSHHGKRLDLKAAAALVQDGQTLALGGNLLHRAPNALARELARQGRRRLHLIKTAGAYDVDLLCAAGCVTAVSAGFVGFENEFGMAPRLPPGGGKRSGAGAGTGVLHRDHVAAGGRVWIAIHAHSGVPRE